LKIKRRGDLGGTELLLKVGMRRDPPLSFTAEKSEWERYPGKIRLSVGEGWSSVTGLAMGAGRLGRGA